MIHKVKRLPRKPEFRRWYAINGDSGFEYWNFSYDTKQWVGPCTYRDVIETPESWYAKVGDFPFLVWREMKWRKPIALITQAAVS